MKQLLAHPVLGPARFNRARLIRFWQFVRHSLSVWNRISDPVGLANTRLNRRTRDTAKPSHRATPVASSAKG